MSIASSFGVQTNQNCTDHSLSQQGVQTIEIVSGRSFRAPDVLKHITSLILQVQTTLFDEHLRSILKKWTRCGRSASALWNGSSWPQFSTGIRFLLFPKQIFRFLLIIFVSAVMLVTSGLVLVGRMAQWSYDNPDEAFFNLWLLLSVLSRGLISPFSTRVFILFFTLLCTNKCVAPRLSTSAAARSIHRDNILAPLTRYEHYDLCLTNQQHLCDGEVVKYWRSVTTTLIWLVTASAHSPCDFSLSLCE